jgi:hypothetical protein
VTAVRYLKWWWAEVYWLAETVGYWIRPYDMLADARRWRWQPRQRCGSADLIRVKLSDGHGWAPQAMVDMFGEDGLRRVLNVDHIHPVPAEHDGDQQ